MAAIRALLAEAGPDLRTPPEPGEWSVLDASVTSPTAELVVERPLPLDHRPGHAGDRRLRPGAVGRPPPPSRRRPGRRWSPCSTRSDARTWRSGRGSAPRTARGSACTASADPESYDLTFRLWPATIGSISARRGGRSRPFAPAGADRRACQPSAWLNWPQIALGLPGSGSPRIRRGACHARSSRVASRRSRPASFSASRPARTLLVRAAGDAPGVEDRHRRPRSGAIVAPPPHGARTTNPPSVPSSRSSDARRVRGGEGAQQVRPVLAGGGGVQGRHRAQVAGRNGRTRGSVARAVEARRLQDPVPGLDLEPEPLVERPAGLGRDEDERPAAGGLGRPRSSRGSGRARARAAARPGRRRSSRSSRPAR